MHVDIPSVLAGFACLASVVSGSALPPASAAEKLLASLQKQAITALKERGAGANGCTIKNAAVRRDWAKLSKKDRKEYIRAVQCLRSAPAKGDPSFAPGAKTRFDDFVAVHINNTMTIHGTGNFLTWHRYITWAYETALREECGYKGTQPYWNWFHSADDMTKSPVFDGSDTSLGGNGEFKEHNGTVGGGGAIFIPSGEGGGCVTTGPFANFSANIGPVRPGMDGLEPSPTGALGSNPRCLSRDLSNIVSRTYFTHDNLHNLTVGLASSSIELMQTEFQGRFGDGFLGMHGSGHFGVGGEASDLYSSINDPSFYLHHSMVDFVYWIWQALHPEQANDVAGTITINNSPPSRDTRKDDLLRMGVTTQDRPISELLDTLGGTPGCYIFE
ncbi:hypothetical protein MCOR25_010172 [Pyricularia grisea]|uniref:Tyrosinase copper-binding domain-containing protein n=1 Tax=Pyricularia grisea TaxID=148305 RepID=A0A6P8BIK3_PYRGI|nr:uncharacterized protein PgNI_00043 [Pyricularia grisea]KAI6351063.1 hypothetical protein MCOR25_010172 [Pyricularia grisea]TLD16452.1 hypothetical protein PgNI_00043 [Pyricularia grisea]